MSAPTRPVDGPSLSAGRPLTEVLATPILTGASVLAGHDGLGRIVERLNVMEVPDIRPWVKPHEFLLTTAYPLRDHPEELPELVADLDDAGLAGLGIKLGRYLDVLPDAVLQVADTRGFPIVLLPDGVGFDEILNEVLTGILNRQAEELARSQRIHRAFLQLVLHGHGLVELTRDLSDLLDVPTVIVSDDGQVLAAARLSDVGCTGDPTTASLRAGRVVIDDVEVACAAVRITAGAQRHGHLLALGVGGDPPDDRVTLESAATVAALTLTKQAEVQAVEDKYRSDLMHDLLRPIEDPADIRRRARRFGWNLDRRLIALVLRLDDATEPVVPDDTVRPPPLTETIQQLTTTRDPDAAVVRFSHEVVVLTEAFDGPSGRRDARRFVTRLLDETERLIGRSASAGLSRPVTEVTAIAGAYDQASRALTIGRDIHGRGAVTHFDELGAYRVLSLVEDRAELDAFAAEVLGELVQDTDTAADLRHTLQVLLDAGGNVAEAARRLHFHYNTLRYRIDKLSSIVGPFTTDARVRLDVQLALLVHAMRGVEERRNA
jgi:PucR family transcriptional regulator, purine catabolism regulatory protein